MPALPYKTFLTTPRAFALSALRSPLRRHLPCQTLQVRYACPSTNARISNTPTPAKSAHPQSIPHYTMTDPKPPGELTPERTLTESEYHKHADELMDYLVDTMEGIGEEVELAGFDVVYASGVLNLSLGDHGTYVINKQPPNKQIWLSSPVSGPKRFDYSPLAKSWICLRTTEDLLDLLSKELSALLQRSIKFEYVDDM